MVRRGEVLRDRGGDRILGHHTVGQLIDPRAARMQNVPWRAVLGCPPPAGIVVAESVNHDIPQRLVPRDQHPFGHPHPNIVKDKEPATEVLCVQVLRLRDRSRVLPQSVGKCRARRRVEIATTTATFRIGLADVNRRLHSLAVDFRKRTIGVEIAQVVDGVNTRALERLRRKLLRFLPQQRVCRAFG